MTDLDAILARHVELTNAAGYDTGRCMADITPWPCDTAIVLAALDERVTFDEELQRRMDAVRPLVAQRDAAIEREARLRAALVLAVETLEWTSPFAIGDDAEATWQRGVAPTLDKARAALATTPEGE